MSSFSYAVDLDLARDVLASLASVGSELDSIVSDLSRGVALLHETWAGSTALAHAEAHASWLTSYRDMHAALHAMRAVVDTASDNYSAAAAANQEMWSRVR